MLVPDFSVYSIILLQTCYPVCYTTTRNLAMKVNQPSPNTQHIPSGLSVLEFVAQDLPPSAPETICKIQKKWNIAIKNLKTSIDKKKTSEALQQAFDTLSQLHWTSQLQPFHIIDLHDLSIFFTADWLTDDHELVMLEALKEDLVGIGKANESFIEKELGCGKHSKQANRLYLDFWRHDSGTSDSSDDED